MNQETIKTFNYKNCIVRVHIPDSTNEEKEKRIQDVKKAMAGIALELKKGAEYGK